MNVELKMKALALVQAMACMGLVACGGADEQASSATEADQGILRTSGDQTPPTVAVKAQSGGGTMNIAALSGAATDNRRLATVSWANNRGGSGTAKLTLIDSRTATWTATAIPLQVGANVVTVTALDAAGNKSTTTASVTMDDATGGGTGGGGTGGGGTTGGTVTAGTDGACEKFYPADFSLVSGQVKAPTAAAVKPTRGLALTESAFKTCEVRVTDHTADGTVGFSRNDYSRRQAFNADNTRMIAYAYDGSWHMYDAVTYKRISKLPDLAGDAEPQWSSTDSNILYYLPTNGMGLKVYELNVGTGVSRVVGDLGARIRSKWGSAFAAWTGSEGSPSADGRYWCFMVDDAAWNSVGVVTWDRATDTIVGTLSTNGDRPNHVSMSPSGNYCVVSGDGARGTVSYSRDFSTQRKILNRSEHSDLALDANGDDVYVAVDYASAGGDVFMFNLRTGARTALFGTYLNGTATALHVSGKAFRKPGWVVVSTYADTAGTNPQWLHRKVMAVQLTANPKIYHLSHHRTQENGYWTTPVASVNRDFSKIVFNSNWATGSALDVDTYMINISPAMLK